MLVLFVFINEYSCRYNIELCFISVSDWRCLLSASAPDPEHAQFWMTLNPQLISIRHRTLLSQRKVISSFLYHTTPLGTIPKLESRRDPPALGTCGYSSVNACWRVARGGALENTSAHPKVYAIMRHTFHISWDLTHRRGDNSKHNSLIASNTSRAARSAYNIIVYCCDNWSDGVWALGLVGITGSRERFQTWVYVCNVHHTYTLDVCSEWWVCAWDW